MKLTIKTKDLVPEQILLDDKDISGGLTAISVNLKAGYVPTVILELCPDDIEIDGDFEILKYIKSMEEEQKENKSVNIEKIIEKIVEKIVESISNVNQVNKS